MQELLKHDRAKVIDLLTERLVFERNGVKLYDAILSKMESSSESEIRRMLVQMRQHRDEEKEHEQWLEEQLRALNADTQAETEMSNLVRRESKGIVDVILDGDNELSHLFHALLTAELADNAGWELLVALARKAGDRAAKREFKRRLREEEDHLTFMRRVVERFARHTVLGEPMQMPVAP